MSVSVELLSFTPEPDRVVAASAKLCYSDVSACNLKEGLSDHQSAKLLAHLVKSGHMSPFEHVAFTFAMDGLSRVCTHQLVRHRLASYSQQSQRYVLMEKPEVVVPPSITKDGALKDKYMKIVQNSFEVYKLLVERGVPREDARYVLPHSWKTRIVVTMNARELHHFFSLRLCRRAQWEIREVARRMLLLVREKAPLIFKLAGPSCVVYGKCKEVSSCGEPYKNVEEVLADVLDF
ncbi:FAD-dependent thymidylate synthase [Thermovirga sp.]|uniref:FAD-dependent thymidylate synthase n=1 Tax=Thermovirga sp. TaxID=2699834 RepID=UPI0025E46D71|nr:FAD-dependent thymidylate synthase [Thermovirga sp.]MBO8154003.1 FAD-dependent thymidylate synthase [Thermovirga sp.]